IGQLNMISVYKMIFTGLLTVSMGKVSFSDFFTCFWLSANCNIAQNYRTIDLQPSPSNLLTQTSSLLPKASPLKPDSSTFLLQK
ncbi:MAG: hypothetical protein LH702_09180, partial [Phormidesmis sp. CAN_BIN44]|nr:hypothetical protein [Phormidesmis sp. CAN_BIN44]